MQGLADNISLEDKDTAPSNKPIKGGRDLTSGPVAKVLMAFALPTLGVNILQSINGSVNAIWIGRLLGEEALAATANATMVMFLMISVLIGLSMATTILIAQATGAGDIGKARQIMGNSAGTFLFIGIIAAVLGWVYSPDVLRLLGTPHSAVALATDYLRVIFVGMPFTFLLILLSSALRGVGDAVSPLRATILNVGLDAGLNPIFIAGLGPIPAMGIAGSALATLIAGAISVAALTFQIYRKDLPVRLRGREWAYLKPDAALGKKLFAIGMPMSISMVIVSISSLVMVGLINREGVDTVAAYGVMNQLWNYVQMPAFAIGSAVSAMAAQNIGAGKWDRVDKITWAGCGINLAMTSLLVVLIALAIDPLLNLFLPTGGAAHDIAKHMNLIVSWSFVLMGISMVLASVVRANGAVIMPMIMMLISIIGVRFSVGFGFYEAYGADAIWAAFITASFIAVLMQVAYYRFGNWRGGRITSPPELTAPNL